MNSLLYSFATFFLFAGLQDCGALPNQRAFTSAVDGNWVGTGTIHPKANIQSSCAGNSDVFCPVESVLPCECSTGGWNSYFAIVCNGPQVTNQDIKDVFAKLRSFNNLPVDAWLKVYDFKMDNTLLTSLDLDSFYHLNIYRFHLYDNLQLTNLTGDSVLNKQTIRAEQLWIQSSGLTHEGVSDKLNHFDSICTKHFSFSSNHLGNAPDGAEIVKGLSEFVLAEGINLSSNNITKIGGGQFQGHGSLSSIVLINNGIQKIGDDAFVIDNPLTDNYPLDIHLRRNRLTPATVNHAHSGVITFGGPGVTIYYDDNDFDSLPEGNFEELLRTPNRYISVAENPIVCNPAVKWLKDETEYFQQRVTEANCVNDPGKTVFTSDLV